ncbi:alpha/beta fold hydrolase [Streptomyces sp. SP18ES09]|uniref:alpha/beta fold hydrolase n=1 Tax=Streptomyces sp. SP18ES09 TaxID=3002532 RepID=UPI002E77F555|nr:alpha/beta fold hydrolase [Streptomyces sp. SP18ES09]MEE1820553.1 alpha/beta fold hydrolase [Streptomyces sp. SP18ES09]
MTTRTPQELAVPVRGGDLAVAHWPGEGPAVIALHGITGNSLSFGAVAERLGDVDLYAPDLRGRAGSADLPAPYGIPAHVEDVLALLDHLGPRQALLLGHSLGAFTTAVAAARHPDRFPRVVLVDGGLGFPIPGGADIDEVIESVIGPAMRRLRATFPDRDAYRALFREHPAFTAHWGPHVEAYVDRDLAGAAPAMRSSCALDAVRADGAGPIGDPETLGAIHRPEVRGTLLWAERGVMDEPQGLYDEERLAAGGLPPDRIVTRRVDGTNHYTILFAEHATAAVADAVRAELKLM